MTPWKEGKWVNWFSEVCLTYNKKIPKARKLEGKPWMLFKLSCRKLWDSMFSVYELLILQLFHRLIIGGKTKRVGCEWTKHLSLN